MIISKSKEKAQWKYKAETQGKKRLINIRRLTPKLKLKMESDWLAKKEHVQKIGTGCSHEPCH